MARAPKPRRGRPPLAAGIALTRPIVIKVSEDKHGAWTSAATRQGQTLSEWLREAGDLAAARGSTR